MDAGRELDALIATKVFGKVANVDTPGLFWGSYEEPMYRERDRERWDRLPDYSTLIEAAWQVVEHLFAEGWALNISGERGPGKPWDVRYWRGRELGMAFADTAPLAICRAALAAIGDS